MSPTETATPVSPPSPVALSQLATSSNTFAMELWSKVRGMGGNLAVSPASISLALAMTWGGARGETAGEMKKVLHFEGTADEVMAATGQLLRSWNTSEGPALMRVANRLFGSKDFAFERSYLEKTQAAFGAPLEPVDFEGGIEATRQHINGWVAQQTQDRIQELLPRGSLKPRLTRLVLVNALYFLATWENPFSEENTHPEPFFVSKAEKKDVPMMHLTKSYNFAQVDGVKVLELPYKGGELAMVFVLPDESAGLEDVERRLTMAQLDEWIGAARSEKVKVALPRFEIRPEGAIELGDALEELGMARAFDAEKADFTGMAKPTRAEDRLHISNVFHTTFVKVDEKGTEAAAATAVVMHARSSMRPQEPKEFRADHPFLFFLRHSSSGMILFMGRVASPRSE